MNANDNITHVCNLVAELAEAMLTDDNGVDENTYDKLYDLLHACNLGEITQRVDACDGRFYIPSE